MKKPLKYGLFLAGSIAIVQIVAILIFELTTQNLSPLSPIKIFLLIVVVIISASIASIISLNTIPHFRQFLLNERSFLRFQSLSHPLLIRLSLEAPGTYHHSLMVANLAYQAAKSIRADAILTRVGAYYHDIGKLEEPSLYIENKKEINPVNINTIVELKKIAKKIINHTTYGLELAKKYSLPSEIMAFITEHHGTTNTMFFLEKAKKINPKVKTKCFYYHGPKPLNTETAIVMLADAVEAKLRLYKEITIEDIKKTVKEVITQRQKEKQLNLCGLNEKQIKKISSSFIRTLSAIHHQRISYKK